MGTHQVGWRSRVARMGAGAAALALLAGIASADGLVIDHTCTDLRRVPVAFLQQAQQQFRIAYGHTSHGSQLVAGMEALRRQDPARFGFGTQPNAGLYLLDRTPAGDLGNPDRTTWARRTRDLLNGAGAGLNLVLWSWCGQVSSASEQDIAAYLELMSGLEADFPRVRFVYMTGHLDGSGSNGNLNRRNEQIREFCRRNGKILFDFADIESYDPDGRVNYMALHARDSCDYRDQGTVRNWADEWVARHPDHGLALPGSAAHTRPLNGALKGRAVWWMLARLAGWPGPAASAP